MRTGLQAQGSETHLLYAGGSYCHHQWLHSPIHINHQVIPRINTYAAYSRLKPAQITPLHRMISIITGSKEQSWTFWGQDEERSMSGSPSHCVVALCFPCEHTAWHERTDNHKSQVLLCHLGLFVGMQSWWHISHSGVDFLLYVPQIAQGPGREINKKDCGGNWGWKELRRADRVGLLHPSVMQNHLTWGT